MADHAAEAVVALQLRDLTPKLVTLLDGKDVSRPFTVEANGRRVTVVQEPVRVNHLGNATGSRRCASRRWWPAGGRGCRR